MGHFQSKEYTAGGADLKLTMKKLERRLQADFPDARVCFVNKEIKASNGSVVKKVTVLLEEHRLKVKFKRNMYN